MIPNLSQPVDSLVASYTTIRKAIGYSGFLLPVVLGPGGWLLGIPFQDNLSSYYHTPLRDVFVGTLSTIGVFLLCYRGYDRVENWTANICCLAAFGLALCPLDAGRDPLQQRSIAGFLHTASGGLFFLTLAVYSLYHFPRSNDRPEEGLPHQWERNLVYRTSGVVILVTLLAIGIYMFLIPKAWAVRLDEWNFLLWTEWIALWAFASAWLTKGHMILAEVAVAFLSIPRQALANRLHTLESPSEPVDDA